MVKSRHVIALPQLDSTHDVYSIASVGPDSIAVGINRQFARRPTGPQDGKLCEAIGTLRRQFPFFSEDRHGWNILVTDIGSFSKDPRCLEYSPKGAPP
jgi:hypothetical protein